MTVTEIIDDVLEAEGSKYTNDPADPGGPTRWGITLKTLRRWRQSGGRRGGHQVTAADVRAREPFHKKRPFLVPAANLHANDASVTMARYYRPL